MSLDPILRLNINFRSELLEKNQKLTRIGVIFSIAKLTKIDGTLVQKLKAIFYVVCKQCKLIIK